VGARGPARPDSALDLLIIEESDLPQAMEKTFKALLAYCGQLIPRTHDLALYPECTASSRATQYPLAICFSWLKGPGSNSFFLEYLSLAPLL
jgi:hypothetical protein